MSIIKANSAIQTIKLAANTKQTEKIVAKPGQAIQLMVDGQLYTGQQHINGKAVRLVRKGRTLEVQLDDQTLAVVEDFYAAPTEAGQAETAQLVDLDPLALALPDTLSAQPLDGEMNAADLQAATTPTAFQATNPLNGTQWAQAASDTKTDAGASAIKAADGAAAFFTFASMAVVGAALSSDSTPAQPTQPDVSRTVTGQFMAGPVLPGHGLKVQLFQADGTTALGEPVAINDQGQFTAVVKNYTGVVIAKVIPDTDDNHDYTDEALGAGKDLNATLMAAGELTAGSTSITLNINPLTTVAVVKMGANPTAAKVAETNTQVGTAFGLTNLTGTTVVPAVADSAYDSVDGLSEGELYGAVLAAMSGKDLENNDLTQTTIDQIAAGISGATLSPSAQVALLQGAAAADAQAPGELRTALINKLAPAATLPDDISGLAVADLTPLVMAKLNTTQLDSLTTTQIADLAALIPSPLGVLDAAGIGALGADITALSAAQLATLTDTQLDGLNTTQIAALAAAGDLADLSATQIEALGTDITGLSAAQLANLTDPQLGGLNPTQIAALATAGDLVDLSATQIEALGTDITGLSAAQVAALSAPQLRGLTPPQIAALASANPSLLTAMDAADIAALGTDITSLTGPQVAALNPTQVGGLTADQINALNTAGLLDNLASPLSTAQISGTAPAGLGFTTVDTADERAMFNAAVDAQVAGNINLTDLAAAVSKVGALADGTDNNSAQPTQAEYTALGITGIDSAAKAALLGDVLDVKAAADANELAEIQTLATATNVVAGYTGSNTAPTNAQLNALLGSNFVNDTNRTAFLGHLATQNTDGTPVTLTQLLAIRNNFGPTVSSFTVADATGTTTTTGKNGDTLTFTVTMSEPVTSTAGLTAVFTVNGTDVTATRAAVSSATGTLVFTGTAPAGNGSVITLKSLVADSGSIVNSNSVALMAPTANAIAQTTGSGLYTLDNTAPTITATYAVNENTASDTALKSITLAANETVTWSGLTGTDSGNFSLNGGTLSFTGVTNKEVKDSYSVSVIGTDAAGNARTQAITVNINNVNEAPTVEDGIANQTFIVGGAVDSFQFLTTAFTDVDSTTLTYSAALVGGGALPGWLSFDPATRTFSGNPPAAGTTTVRVTASDGALTVNDDFVITAVAAPSLSTTLGGVTNLDVRSKIVLSVGETVTAVSGKVITLTDLGGTGYQGENITHTQTINVNDTSKVTIVGTGANTKIIIDPGFDLDLAANYRLSIDTGAFLGGTSGQGNVAFSDVNFSTVAPGAGFANAMQAQSMNTTTGALENSLKWFDATNIGIVFSGQGNGTPLDFGTGDFAAAVKGAILTSGANANTVLQGAGNMRFNNFGANDLLYVDNQDHANTTPQASLNDNLFAGGLGTTNQPFQLAVEGTDGNSGGAYFIDFVIASGITLPASVANDQLLQNVISNNWSNTGMVIAA